MKDRKKEVNAFTIVSEEEREILRKAVTVVIEKYVRDFAKGIAHGDDEHREWLIRAVEAHLSGQPIPPVQGG